MFIAICHSQLLNNSNTIKKATHNINLNASESESGVLMISRAALRKSYINLWESRVSALQPQASN